MLVQDHEVTDRSAGLEHDLDRKLVEFPVCLRALGRVVPDAELLDEGSKAVAPRGEEELPIRVGCRPELELHGHGPRPYSEQSAVDELVQGLSLEPGARMGSEQPAVDELVQGLSLEPGARLGGRPYSEQPAVDELVQGLSLEPGARMGPPHTGAR